MALPALATIEEFRTWEVDTVVNAARAEAILAAASTLIRGRTGRAWVTDSGPETGLTEVQLDTVRDVALTVASRVYNNPQGLITDTEGPFTGTVAAWSALGLELTPEELDRLSVTPPTAVPGLWSLRVVAPAGARATRLFTFGFWEDDIDDELFEGDGFEFGIPEGS